MQDKQMIWEVWDFAKDGIVTATADHFNQLRENSPSTSEAILLHRFIAATHEEAMAIRNLRMGFGHYVPEGDPEICPLGCGSYYYPSGSGDCPYCGPVRTQTKMCALPGFEALLDRHLSSSSEALEFTRVHFGELELMLLPSEQTAETLEQNFEKFIAAFNKTQGAKQDGAGQLATCPESKPGGNEKPPP